jgi:hypothetical protein
MEENAKIFVPAIVILLAAFMTSYFDVGYTGHFSFNSERCRYKGDMDDNGFITGHDLREIDRHLQALNSPSYFKPRQNNCADVNNDGYVDETDMNIITEMLLSGKVHEEYADKLDPVKISVSPYDGPCKVGEIACQSPYSMSPRHKLCVYNFDRGKTEWSIERNPPGMVCRKTSKGMIFIDDSAPVT